MDLSRSSLSSTTMATWSSGLSKRIQIASTTTSPPGTITPCPPRLAVRAGSRPKSPRLASLMPHWLRLPRPNRRVTSRSSAADWTFRQDLSRPTSVSMPCTRMVSKVVKATSSRTVPEGTKVPFYTAITQHGGVSDETKAMIAQEITRIHSTLMKVPRSNVRVVFLSYPKGSGYTAGEPAPTAALNCVLRSGHTAEDKAEMFKLLWAMFQAHTALPTDQLAMSLQEIPADNAMEMGEIMRSVSHERIDP